MKKLSSLLLLMVLSACASQQVSKQVSKPSALLANGCVGTTELPAYYQGKFQAVEDEALLAASLGEPTKGKLCQGQVYELKQGESVVIYRAWNSTNPGSEMGKWWASAKPKGKTASYREDYEICYQWSPLDKLTTCKLKAGTKVVVGNGQSAECSPYLTYPVSAAQQIYIDDASMSADDCKTYDAEFRWSASP